MQIITDDCIARWGQVFRVLSLDYMLPLWKHMGLVFSDDMKLQVKNFMRDAYLKRQKITGHEYKVQIQQLIETTLNDVEISAGKDIAEDIRYWCNRYITTYNRDAGMAIDKWRKEIIALYYRSLATVKEPNVLEWDEERYASFAKFIEEELIIPDEKLEEVIERFEHSVDDTLCTEWDRILFAQEREESALGDLGTLFVLIQNIGENYNLFKFWVHLTDKFTKVEVASIVNWIKYQIGEQYIPLRERNRYIPPFLVPLL